MTQTRDLLANLYALRIDRGGKRLPVIEQHLDIPRPPDLSEDDRRNENATYEKLVESHPDALGDLFQELLRDMRSVSYEHSNGILDALDFLQSIVSSALWKHHIHIDGELAKFAREFDRLDVPAERRRLYELAQSQQYGEKRGGHPSRDS